MPANRLTFTGGKQHTYRLDGVALPSVTTILKAAWAKPALTYWAADQAAGYAVNRWDELADLDTIARYEKVRKAPWAERDRKAFRGTELHRIGEALAHREAVQVPAEYEGIAQGYAAWLDRNGVEVVAAERPVVYLPADNLRLPYAGTFDLVADLNDGCRWLLDLKTGSGVYPETVLQLAAYRYASHYLPDKDGELEPMIDVDRVGVVHVLPDATPELLPVAADRRAWWVFCHAAHVALYAREVDQAWKDKRPWPVLEAVTA